MIESTIERIYSIIDSKGGGTKLGLLNGIEGHCLFYYYLATAMNIDVKDNLENKLDEIIENINQTSFLSSGLYGLSGFYWLKNHINLDLDQEINNLIEEKIIMSIEIDLEESNFDLFSGFLGKIESLINNSEAPRYLVLKTIDKILGYFDQKKFEDDLGIYWITKDEKSGGHLNFGIPHGMLGICLFLINLIEKNIAGEKIVGVKENLSRCLAWITANLSSDNDRIMAASMDKTRQITSKGRLGWCYGNLSVAYTMIKGGSILNEKRFSQYAMAILDPFKNVDLNIAKVQYTTEFNCYDTGLCHGLSSIAFMFNKIYKLSQVEEHRRMSYLWLDITLNNINKKLDAINKQIRTSKRAESVNFGLLHGLAGSGLVLASFLKDQSSKWDKILLL